jgi:predicted glycoside hydrolase/deacetylase ChbG (UPF0249 family)
MDRYLIVNADDLGISQGTNLAIERAFREGIVTSASLMANMAALDHAVDQVVARNPGLGIGLHLCLTSGRPVLPAGEVPLLVGPDGMFCHGFLGLMRLRRAQGDEAVEQMTCELEAQAARLDGRGIAVDHVNGHQHIHMIPAIFPVAARLARERKAALRIPDAGRPGPRLPIIRRLQASMGSGLLKVAILSTLTRWSRRQGESFVSADHCLGVAQSGGMTLSILRDLLQGLPPGVTEIFVHPGQPDAVDPAPVCSALDREFLRSGRRAVELEAVLGMGLREMLSRQGVAVTSFREVWKKEIPQRPEGTKKEHEGSRL